jgi:hypothetical protein
VFTESDQAQNGYSVIRAEVRVQGQAELVRLSRFINLTETGPRLEEVARFDTDGSDGRTLDTAANGG